MFRRCIPMQKFLMPFWRGCKDLIMRAWTRILGIDPGFRVTGYGIIESNGQESRHISSGIIKAVVKDDPAERLEVIFNEVAALVQSFEPHELAIEQVFVHKNASSALKLGQARSAAICATFGSNMPVHEYAPREMKQAITGKGSAEKAQVQHMVKLLLNLDAELSMDASDALGIALCHAHTRNMNQHYAEAIS